jgi:hypothetical protein
MFKWFLGDRNTSPPSSFPFLAPLHTQESRLAYTTPWPSGPGNWQYRVCIFSIGTYIFKETVHNKNCFADVATATTGMTTTTCTWFTKQHVEFRHFELETVYKTCKI